MSGLGSIQIDLFNANLSGVKFPIIRDLHGIESEDLFARMSDKRLPEGYEANKAGRIFRVFEDGRKIYTNIIYTKDDFFKIDTKSETQYVKKVKDCLLYLKETMPKKFSLPICDFKVDQDGDPIYLHFDLADDLLNETMKMYLDKSQKMYLGWERNFIYDDDVMSWCRSNNIHSEDDLKKGISSMIHIRSLESIKDVLVEKKVDKLFVEIVEQRIAAVRKDGDYFNKMKKKYIEAYNDDIKLAKPTEKDAWKCVSDDKNRPNYCGSFHDSGFAVYTDAQVLLASKSLYDKKHDGKIIGKDGNYINAKFPPYNSIKPDLSCYKEFEIDVDDLLSFIKKHNKKCKFRGIAQLHFRVVFVDGVLYSADNLERLLTASKLEDGVKFYVKTIAYQYDTIIGTVYFESKNGSWGLCMPMNFTGDEEGISEYAPFRYDIDWGIFHDNAVYFSEKKSDKSKSSDNKQIINNLRLAKARAKAIIIRQRQRARKGVRGIGEYYGIYESECEHNGDLDLVIDELSEYGGIVDSYKISDGSVLVKFHCEDPDAFQRLCETLGAYPIKTKEQTLENQNKESVGKRFVENNSKELGSWINSINDLTGGFNNVAKTRISDSDTELDLFLKCWYNGSKYVISVGKDMDNLTEIYNSKINQGKGGFCRIISDYIDLNYSNLKENDTNAMAKAKAKAIIIRQRQRARKGVSGINYEMD